MFLNLDKKEKEKSAIVDSAGRKVTYGDLIKEAEAFAGFVPRRSLVFVLCKNSVGGCLGFTNCLITESVPLMLSVDMDKGLLEVLVDTYHPAFLWKPEETVGDEKVIMSSNGYSLIATGLSPYPMYEELSMLLTTSGSTGSPKLVRHSYANLEAQGRNISAFFELTGEDRPLLDLPIHYTMGLSVLISHLYAGATVFITPHNVLDAEYWTFLKSNHITSITNIPYTYELLYKLRFLRMDLPDLKIVTQGGGKLKADIYIAFAEYADKTGRKFIPTYGQTEGTARMAYLPAEYALTKIACIGKAIPEGKLYLVDDNNEVITTPDTVGEMVYEGPNVTLGYALKGEDLSLGDERHGVLRTGDLARTDEDGFVYIMARMGRILKINGHRVGLDECEQIIKSVFEVECACTGTDKLAIAYVNKPDGLDEIKAHLAEVTNLNSSFFEVRYIETIPRNEAGKVLYSALAKE